MKIIYLLIILLLHPFGSYACEMISPVRHNNPDSTVGGLVSSKAKVAPTAYIGYDAKVCDSAWVDGNARILDRAIIQGNAWIKEFSTVKGNAVVRDNVVVWGNQGYPVVIEGEASVYENARILAGTRISGQSNVYGNVSLTSSEVSAKARVCEKFDLKNEMLEDDYFCPQGAYTISKTTAELQSYDLEKINPMKGFLKFKFNGHSIVEDASKFKVWLNGELLDSISINQRKGILEVNTYGVELDGINKVVLEGVDIYGKVIFLEETEFILGSGFIDLSLGVGNKGIQDSGLEAKLTYKYDSRDFTGEFEYIAGGIRLLNIPQGVIQDDIGVEISGVGDLLYFSESYNSISSMPSEIDVYSYPEFIDNDLSLTGNLANWDVSHPEMVFSESVGDSTQARLNAPDVGRLVVGKRVRLLDSDGGLRVELSLPSPNKLLIGPLATLEVVIISLRDKRLEQRVYQAGVDSITEDRLTIGSLNKGGDYIVFLRLSGAGWKSEENYVLRRVSKPKATLTFKPYHFEVMNKSPEPLYNELPLTEFTEVECSNQKYNLKSGYFDYYVDNDFKFLSAGELKDLAYAVSENRIFGEMTGTNILRKNLTLTLAIFQGGVKFGEFPLSICAKEFLSQDKSEKSFHYGRRANFVSYLFAIPFESLKFLSVSEGSKVKIALKAEWVNENGIFESLLSDEKELTILVSTKRGNKIFGGLDTYDSRKQGILRTGGDKWLLPSVSKKTEEILDANPTWGLNDGSKLNGGWFKPHEEHRVGTDIDISNYFNFLTIESFANVNESKRKALWQSQLSQIEKFLSNVQGDYPYFENIFVTRKFSIEERKIGNDIEVIEEIVKIDPRFIDSYFENRCFNGRFISLNMHKKYRSLLTHADKHYDHLHISFNDIDKIDGSINYVKNVEPSRSTYRFGTIAISLQDNKIKLSPYEKDENDNELFNNKAILWRVQDGEGYGNPDLHIDYGRWENGVVQYNHEEPTFNSSNHYWLYATIADTLNGGCIEYKALFKVNDDKEINFIREL